MAFVPGIVYTHLVTMLTRYRAARLSAPELAPIDVIKQIKDFGMVKIEAKREDDVRGKANIIVYLLAPESQLVSRSASFKTLLAGLPRAEPGRLLNIIIVSAEKLANRVAMQVRPIIGDRKDVVVEHHEYAHFLIETPAHKLVPTHTIMDPADAKVFLDTFYASDDMFQHISVLDPMCIWLGARVGMFIKINRKSETAGRATAYRYVIPAKNVTSEDDTRGE